jgi:hypothetical protein
MQQNKPSVGRIVHYTHPATGEPQAAIVTYAHEDGTVDLHVFASPQGAQDFGASSFAQPNVPAGPSGTEPAKGCWNWPPRT